MSCVVCEVWKKNHLGINKSIKNLGISYQPSSRYVAVLKVTKSDTGKPKKSLTMKIMHRYQYRMRSF
jgi:hypothetical protein